MSSMIAQGGGRHKSKTSAEAEDSQQIGDSAHVQPAPACTIVFATLENAGITAENRRILDQFSRTATARYGAGKGTQAEALKAQVELARVDSELVMIEQRCLTAQARLNVLMDRPPEREVGTPEPAKLPARAPSLEELNALAREHNPELEAYRYAVERGEAALALSVNEFMPDLMVKFRQMVQHGDLQGGMWAGIIALLGVDAETGVFMLLYLDLS